MTDDISELELIDNDLDADTSVFGFDDAPAEDARARGMPGPQERVSSEKLVQIIEGAILASNQPLNVSRIIDLFDEEFAPSKEQVLAALESIAAACEARGFELKEVASGWRFQVRNELAPWVNRLWDEKPQRYSRALLETLSLIAYRQPITRGDIEEIRGVAVSSHIIKTLLERDWIKVVGQRDVPGRPSLFATTRQFLDYFNLKSLEELPSLSEIRDLDEIAPGLDLGAENAPDIDPESASDGMQQQELIQSDHISETIADASENSFSRKNLELASEEQVEYPLDDILTTEEINNRD